MCHCNEQKLWRSPKTEQFMTAKISVNALKHGRRTRSVQRQGSSQLQKYKATRKSPCIAIDQKVCDSDGRHQWRTKKIFIGGVSFSGAWCHLYLVYVVNDVII